MRFKGWFNMSLRSVTLAAGIVSVLAGSGAAFAQDAAASASTPAPTDTSASTGTPAVTAAQPGAPAAPASEVAALQPASAGFVPAAYLKGAARAPEASIEGWVGSPSSLLAANPAGGLPLANTVLSFAGSDNRAVALLVGLGSGTEVTPSQRAAIGAGLARTAQGAQSVAPDYAAYIQQKVAESGSPELIAAFTAALAETAVAALGTGAGTGAGGGAGATGGGSGSLTGGGTPGGGTAGFGSGTTVATDSGSFNAGGGGTISGSNGTNGGTTVALVDVSRV